MAATSYMQLFVIIFNGWKLLKELHIRYCMGPGFISVFPWVFDWWDLHIMAISAINYLTREEIWIYSGHYFCYKFVYCGWYMCLIEFQMHLIILSNNWLVWFSSIFRALRSHKNKPRFNRDKPSKLINKLIRFNRVLPRKLTRKS